MFFYKHKNGLCVCVTEEITDALDLLLLSNINDITLIKSLYKNVARLLKEVDTENIPQIMRCLQGVEEEIKHHTDELSQTQNRVLILDSYFLICVLIIYLIIDLVSSRQINVLKGNSRLHKEHHQEKAKLFRKQKEIERLNLQLKEEWNWVQEEGKLLKEAK